MNVKELKRQIRQIENIQNFGERIVSFVDATKEENFSIIDLGHSLIEDSKNILSSYYKMANILDLSDQPFFDIGELSKIKKLFLDFSKFVSVSKKYLSRSKK